MHAQEQQLSYPLGDTLPPHGRAIDVADGVKLAEALVGLGLGTRKRGDYAAPRRKAYAGLAAPDSPR